MDSQDLGLGVGLSFGAVQNIMSKSGAIALPDLKLSKPPLKRSLVNSQLFTGHLRLDLADPLTKGNFIVIRGDKRSSGKNLVVQGAINSFLKEDKQNRVVYVGQTKKTAEEYFSKTH